MEREEIPRSLDVFGAAALAAVELHQLVVAGNGLSEGEECAFGVLAKRPGFRRAAGLEAQNAPAQRAVQILDELAGEADLGSRLRPTSQNFI